MGAPQHIRHLVVRIYQPLLHIHQKNDHIRRVNGNLSLSPHLGQYDISAVRFYAAGVDQCKCLVQPGHIRIDSVAGNARSVLHNGNPLSRQGIEQRGFPYIRPPHHCHNRFRTSFCHNFTFLTFRHAARQ